MSRMIFEFEGEISRGSFYDRNSTKSVTMQLNDDDLSVHEILNEFQNFLSAAGYKFEEGAELIISSKNDDWNDSWSTGSWNEEDEVRSNLDLVDAQKNSKYNFSDEEVNAEVIRIRDSTPGLSEEAYELAAYHNLAKKADEGV
jgi:hypothetical protein